MMCRVIRIIKSVVVFSFDLFVKSSLPVRGIDSNRGAFCSC